MDSKNQLKAEQIKQDMAYVPSQEEVDSFADLAWGALLDEVLRNYYIIDIEKAYKIIVRVLHMHGPMEVMENPIKRSEIIGSVFRKVFNTGVEQQKALVEFRPVSLTNMLWWRDKYGTVKESGLIYLQGPLEFRWVNKGDKVQCSDVRDS
jgi:hypothetical protein